MADQAWPQFIAFSLLAEDHFCIAGAREQKSEFILGACCEEQACCFTLQFTLQLSLTPPAFTAVRGERERLEVPGEFTSWVRSVFD